MFYTRLHFPKSPQRWFSAVFAWIIEPNGRSQGTWPGFKIPEFSNTSDGCTTVADSRKKMPSSCQRLRPCPSKWGTTLPLHWLFINPQRCHSLSNIFFSFFFFCSREKKRIYIQVCSFIYVMSLLHPCVVSRPSLWQQLMSLRVIRCESTMCSNSRRAKIPARVRETSANWRGAEKLL